MSIRINKVYTKSGDLGETSLVDGSRVKKTSIRCKSFGDLDELNSYLGLCKEELKVISTIDSKKKSSLIEVIEYLQQELFDLGAELATPPGFTYPTMWVVNESHVKHIEEICDFYNGNLEELKSFILPGGNKLSTYFHISRTVCRRAERTVVELYEVENKTNKNILSYLNRLSDLLFVLARYVLILDNNKATLWIRESERIKPNLS